MERSFLQELEKQPLHSPPRCRCTPERSLERGFAAKAVTDRRVLYGPDAVVGRLRRRMRAK